MGAAHDMVQHILHDPANEIDGILWGALSGLEIILREARDYADETLMDAEKAKVAFEEICKQRKPDAPVMMDGESIGNLQRESIAVLREVTEQAEDAAFTRRKLLNAVDDRDKANVSLGGES